MTEGEQPEYRPDKFLTLPTIQKVSLLMENFSRTMVIMDRISKMTDPIKRFKASFDKSILSRFTELDFLDPFVPVEIQRVEAGTPMVSSPTKPQSKEGDPEFGPSKWKKGFVLAVQKILVTEPVDANEEAVVFFHAVAGRKPVLFLPHELSGRYDEYCHYMQLLSQGKVILGCSDKNGILFYKALPKAPVLEAKHIVNIKHPWSIRHNQQKIIITFEEESGNFHLSVGFQFFIYLLLNTTPENRMPTYKLLDLGATSENARLRESTTEDVLAENEENNEFGPGFHIEGTSKIKKSTEEDEEYLKELDNLIRKNRSEFESENNELIRRELQESYEFYLKQVNGIMSNRKSSGQQNHRKATIKILGHFDRVRKNLKPVMPKFLEYFKKHIINHRGVYFSGDRDMWHIERILEDGGEVK